MTSMYLGIGVSDAEWKETGAECLAYHEDEFIAAAQRDQGLKWLMNPPRGVSILTTPSLNINETTARPEIFMLALCGPRGRRPSDTQLIQIASTLERYVRGVGNQAQPTLPAFRNSQGAELAQVVGAIDTTVPGPWLREWTTRTEDASRRYAKDWYECRAINIIASTLRERIATYRAFPGYQTSTPIPCDLIIALGHTNYPSRRQRDLLAHAGTGKNSLYAIDAVSKTLFGEEMRLRYFTLQVVHRRECTKMAFRICMHLMAPLRNVDPDRDMLEDEPGTQATDEDYWRNFGQVILMGGWARRAARLSAEFQRRMQEAFERQHGLPDVDSD
ncbi:hypothetical protein BDZ85DRAFT_128819 [Elsinoe ampelina]|uniref:Uncharacterized protein n=1 Tax=Elsinoe ampelina TaxID=302913 RepID=A0A6A6GA71_9PEZI|nr:hypothetical protein BDZ85DRAFT_128819 [Elsinoe ampelina]